MASESGKAGGFMLGILVGGLVGSAVAMLYTPMTGKKLRKQIAKTTDNLLEDVNDYIDAANDMIKERSKQAESLIDEAKRLISNAV